jgi:hypothetical protein
LAQMCCVAPPPPPPLHWAPLIALCNDLSSMVRLLKAAAEAEAAAARCVRVTARNGAQSKGGRVAPAPIISPSVTDSVSLKMPF